MKEYDIHLAIINNNIEYVKNNPEEYNKRNYLTLFPLHRACIEKKFEIIKLLVESGKININAINMIGETALHSLIKRYENKKDLEIIEYLINNGSNYNLRDFSGKTSFDYLNDENRIIIDEFKKKLTNR